jgi:hypothetical protein
LAHQAHLYGNWFHDSSRRVNSASKTALSETCSDNGAKRSNKKKKDKKER